MTLYDEKKATVISGEIGEMQCVDASGLGRIDVQCHRRFAMELGYVGSARFIIVRLKATEPIKNLLFSHRQSQTVPRNLVGDVIAIVYGDCW